MIKNNNNSISSVYKETTVIGKIYKGIVKLYESWRKLLASGIPPLILNKCKGVDLVDYKIKGNSVQNGIPTPDNPIEVESVGDKTKNLFDVKEWFPDYVNDENGITYTNSDFSSIASKRILAEQFKENTRYTVSLDFEITNADSNGFTVAMYDLNGTRLKAVFNDNVTGDKSGRVVLTNNANTTIARILISYNTSGRVCNVKLKNIQIEENTTATEFEPYGYKIPITVRGKNELLISKPYTIQSGNGVAWTYSSDGRITANGTATGYSSVSLLQKRTIPEHWKGKTIYVNICGTHQNIVAQLDLLDANNKTITYVTSANAFIDLSLYPNATFFNLQFKRNNNVVTKGDFYPTITIGKADTEYEPYVEPVTTNIYLNEPLRKIGDYADYIDFENGKVIRSICQRIFDGTENFVYVVISDNLHFFRLSSAWFPVRPSSNVYGYALCNKYPIVPASSRKNKSVFGQFTNKSSVDVSDMDYSNTDSDVTQWKTHLAEEYDNGTPLIIYMTMETPTEETIELPNIPTRKGTNIIEVDTTIQPSNMEVSYYGKEVE